MTPSQRKDRKAKALAEVLALIAETGAACGTEHPQLPDSEDERLWQDATAFGAALEKLFDRHPDRRVGKPGRRRPGIWLG